jgi:hypothetical protein
MPVPTNYRWLFEDPVAATSYRVPINPNKMTSPFPERSLDSVQTIRQHWRIRETVKNAAHEWRFSGVIRDIDHYDNLYLWSLKPNPFTITDHLGRIFEVVPVRFIPDEKRPSARISAKFDYEFLVYVLSWDYTP